MNAQSTGYEYIVVGSGAGGGVVAARLAEAGHTVLLLEAGGDPKLLQGGGPVGPNRMPEDYEVPTFHAMSTENEAMRWEFFVRHYTDQKQQEADDKFVKSENGVFYPRAGTLGGCTAHDAMIMVYPHNADWDHIKDITGDVSWDARNMRRYFQRLENCRYRWPYRLLYRLTGWNPTKHGFSGWLGVEKAAPAAALHDRELVKIIKKAAWACFWELADLWGRIKWLFQSQGDPNDWRLVKKNAVGVHYAPIHTFKHARNGTREFLLDVARRHPDRLKIELDALVTKVLFDESNRAIGVAYLKGARLYRAAFEPNKSSGEPRTAMAAREVILSGGAYNTPQLLMLSGIGPQEQLAKHKIPLRVNLPGVGRNLQDRYEVGIVNRLKQDWAILQNATFTRDDPQCRQWTRWRKGVYTTNGAAFAVIKRSLDERSLPDLFIFALIGYFKGYLPGYSKLIADRKNYLTWCILKAHTENRGGTVELVSDDPRQPPHINFHYFKEGRYFKDDLDYKDADPDGWRHDLDSLVAGINFVRTLTKPAKDAGIIVEEELPGAHRQTDEQLGQFVQDNAWGHHASCTCKIGPATDPNAVLDSNFRVYGVSNLRVVDASVFPRIPGFFIVSCVYMIGEKAADAILADAGQARVPRCVYEHGFWCKIWSVLKRGACGIACGLSALRPIGKMLLGLIGALAAVLPLVVAASWLIFEPPSSNPDVDKELQTARAIIDQFAAKPPVPAAVPGGSSDLLTNVCVKANFTVAANLSPKLSVGILQGKSYKAWVRFSNGGDDPMDYRAGDFHRMAVKLVGVSGERLPSPGDEDNTQDLMFGSSDGYFAGDPQQLHDFFAACMKNGGSCRVSNPYVLWYMLTHPHGAWNFWKANKHRATLSNIHWYSVGAADLGNQQQVRYSAVACEPQTQYGKPGETLTYLQERLQNRLDPMNGNHVCFDLRVKVRGAQSVENALASWGEGDWLKVATIDIPPQTFTSSAQRQFCERLTFNSWHGLKAHRPLGGLNRVFRDVLPTLQDARLKANGLVKLGPVTGDEMFK